MIFGDAFERVADKAHAARLEVFLTVEIIEDFARQRIGGERIDREIAARGVFLPVIGVLNLGVAAVGRNIAPQCCHFYGPGVVDNGGDRAMLDAGRHGFDIGGFEAADHFFGWECRRAIDILHLQPQQRIAHRSADKPHIAAFGIQRDQQALHAGPLAPGCFGEFHVKSSPARGGGPRSGGGATRQTFCPNYSY